MNHFFKKRTVLRTVLSILLALAMLLTASAGLQTLRFHRFSAELFREEMSSDTLSMHYTIAFPETYGIPKDTVALTPYSHDSQEESIRQLKARARTAASIKAPLLARESRSLLLLLRAQLADRLREAEFPYYAEPLSPGSGVQSTLPILLAEYTFRNKQDVDNYLALLSQLPAYLDGIAVYEKEKADAGLFMSDSAADQVTTQCYEILSAETLTDDSHFLCTTFAQRLQALTDAGLLTEEEAASYREKNRSLLLTCVQPAYESLGDSILLLKGSGKNEQGLSHFPDGKEYYAQLFAQTTGCSRPLTEVKQLLLKRMKEETQALALLVQKYPDLPALFKSSHFPELSAPEMLDDLQKRMQDAFPPMPEPDSVPACTVKEVSKSLEDYCAPAFYLTPPIDDNSENSIYVNQKENPSGVELYTTLAHEGYPGHLYQTVYDQLYKRRSHANPAYALLHYGGYSEGWALYVEFLSYDYAKELLLENGAEENELLALDALRLNRGIQLCLYSLLDLEIHYEGADFEAVCKTLRTFGIDDESVCRDIYDYIVQEPANYPKYYVGCLEFELLKETAKEKWQDAYSDVRFHQTVLETGPCPFEMLWERME
ncbi:MAG: DUF885 domain-containing protein [Lachnospiraceae bacterium]|nr:DUF885 domain-containing protein [Lachnospiraceae bacterium]